MKNKQQTEERVNAALSSLDDIQRAEANPFLYTRVMQAIENKTDSTVGNKWVLRLGIALLIFSAVNVYTFVHFQNSNTESAGKTGIEAFANEYGITEESNS